jgi:uncharacterized membrane protein/nitrite reductase/ring-hydroxylating ferredoxin subunit
MKSKAHLKSHPLHPILIPFPIAFFTGTLVFDILGVLKDERFHDTAENLLIAGIGMAVLAAVPGIIDFIYTVPPQSSAKKRATKHGLVNVCMLALFSICLAYRLKTNDPSPGTILGLESVGVLLMMYAGWMGGTLVHRNQIGVDPRYAFAGKWKEVNLGDQQGRIEVGNSEELKRDQMKLVHVSGKRIVIARTENGYVAFDDRCTHKGGSLAGGMMMCGTVQCPWHGTQFDVSSGNVKAGPGTEKIFTYKMETDGNKLYLIFN